MGQTVSEKPSGKVWQFGKFFEARVGLGMDPPPNGPHSIFSLVSNARRAPLRSKENTDGHRRQTSQPTKFPSSSRKTKAMWKKSTVIVLGIRKSNIVEATYNLSQTRIHQLPMTPPVLHSIMWQGIRSVTTVTQILQMSDFSSESSCLVCLLAGRK